MKLTMQITSSTPFFYFLEAIETISKKNWVEGTSGSMSMILDMKDLWPYIADAYNPQEYLLDVQVPELSDQLILVTGDQIPLRNVAEFKFKLHRMVGVIQINFAGTGYRIVWGFQDGCQPTRFLSAHLLGHNERLKFNRQHRILVHAFPTNLVQKTYLDHLENENQFSYDLWNALPALAEMVPEGLGLISESKFNFRVWVQEIITKFRQYRMVVLKYHGLVVSAQDWDELKSLMDLVDKAALNAIRFLNEKDYALKPDFFTSFVQSQNQNLELNPQVLKYGLMSKTEIIAPDQENLNQSPKD